MTFDLKESANILARTPDALRAMLGDLGEQWIRGSEGPETFSPFDVVGHLIDGEETDWMPRARIILSKVQEPRFETYDRFRHRTRNMGRALETLLDEFALLRKDNLTLLNSWNLTETELNLRGIHPAFGPVTLRELLAAWVVHDLGHVAQVARVLAKQYRDAIGPWAPYLPVVTDRPRPAS
jgi:DinB superfamily